MRLQAIAVLKNPWSWFISLGKAREQIITNIRATTIRARIYDRNITERLGDVKADRSDDERGRLGRAPLDFRPNNHPLGQ
jgi:hypothetical protein